MGQMLKDLGSFNLMPTFGHMLNALNGERKQYINMVNAAQDLRIEFPMDRIIINQDGGNLNSFIEMVPQYLDALKAIFPDKLGYRMSVVTNKVYQGTIEEYNTLYRQLFTYKQATPFEWDNRIAEKKGLQSGEIINSTSAIRRCQLSTPKLNNGRITDAINCEIDVNTVPENRSNRFNLLDAKEHVRSLYAEVESTCGLLQRYF
jgi:hypothetical protein